MKVWVKTKLEEKLNEITGEITRVPYLAGQGVRYSIIELGKNECLCRVAGAPAQINSIIADTDITQLTDEEAREIIKNKYPNSDLENLDIPDPEIDGIAKALGIDPKIRADIQVPTRGKQVLQDQENYLMAHICEKIGLTRDYWDVEAPKSDYQKGIDIERDIKEGNKSA